MLYYVIKYTIYSFGLSGLALLSYSKFYNKSLKKTYFDLMWLYCKFEAKCMRCKSKLTSMYRANRIYSPSEDIFYYKKNQIVAKTMLLKLIMDSYSYGGDYDFVTYEITNDSGEKIYRIFDNERDILKEFSKARQIEYKPPKVRIISAMIVINRNKTEELYDVTPKGLGVEFQGNKLYSYNFINYFFNINPGTNYKVTIIDSNINEMVLVNNSQQREVICIKSKTLEIENSRIHDCTKLLRENLIDKIKKRLFLFFYSKVKD